MSYRGCGQKCRTVWNSVALVRETPRLLMLKHDDSIVHTSGRRRLMGRFSQFCVLSATLAILGGCGTLTERYSGRPSIIVRLREQEAYLYRGTIKTASSPISSGREGYRTPVGRFRVIRKDEDHRSSIYGDYVDASGKVVKANVDKRRDGKPPGSHFVGAAMPYFLEFSPGYGLHEGYLPGVPASHGCIRMPRRQARQFYAAARIGTPVVVEP